MLVAIVAASLASQAPDRMILEGRSAEARALLEAQVDQRPGDVQALFLLASACIDLGDHRCAIRRLREAIAADPRAPRLRLELARAFFLARDYDNADRQFRRALASDLPEPVRANVQRFLASIRKHKRFNYEVSVGFAPDTNINAGSSAREVTLLGLPFELDPSARSKSGIGINLGGSLEYLVPIGGDARLRAGATARHRQYSRSQFTDTVVSAWLGPRWQSDSQETSVVGTMLLRNYGGRAYQRGIGLRGEWIRFLGRRTAIGVEASGQYLRYPKDELRDGPLFIAAVSATRMLSTATTARANLAVIRQSAKVDDFANWTVVPALGASRDLKGGFTLGGEVSLAWSRFDGPDAFFDIRRRDVVAEASLSLLNRRIALGEFTPSVELIRSRRRSNIGIYDSDQTRLEVNFTRAY